MAEKPTSQQQPEKKPSDNPAERLASLRQQMKSVFLSTLGEDGNPHSGYTPFVFDGADIIVLVSQLSLHTRDLLANGQVSAMLISDESQSAQIFARTRVSYQCAAQVVERSDETHAELLGAMRTRHGKMIDLLSELPDFVLFRLKPASGQFVMGFGQAFRLRGDAFDEFEHATSA